MKVVILTGNQGNQKALCNKVAEVCEISAIVLSENIPRRKPLLTKRLQNFVNRINNRLFGSEFVNVWFQMLKKYDEQFPSFPNVPIIKVRNVNDLATLDSLEKFSPDLTIVSGTNLVGRKVIDASKKIVNLHTGISPYVKGGPNCTNWCLAKNWFHLIGNTIMWLDTGIDTGNIIASEQTPLNGNETLFELHWKVMQHAHDLYIRVLRQIAEGKNVPSVSQDSIAEGTLFYTTDWSLTEIRNALKNFRENYKPFFANEEKRRKLVSDLKLVALE